MSIPITQAEFMSAVFHTLDAGAAPVVCQIHTVHQGERWNARSHNEHMVADPGVNNYFGMASHIIKNGKIDAGAESFSALHVVVLDDVGTKSAGLGALPLAPSYVIESSPGNHHVGYILDTPCHDADRLNRLYNSLTRNGFSDKGAKSPTTRWMRLPIGINNNKKYGTPPPAVRLIEWHPSKHCRLDDIEEAFRVTDATDQAKPKTKPQSDDPFAGIHPEENDRYGIGTRIIEEDRHGDILTLTEMLAWKVTKGKLPRETALQILWDERARGRWTRDVPDNELISPFDGACHKHYNEWKRPDPESPFSSPGQHPDQPLVKWLNDVLSPRISDRYLSYNRQTMEYIDSGVFFNPLRGAYHLLNDNELLEVKADKLLGFIERIAGELMDYERLSDGVAFFCREKRITGDKVEKVYKDVRTSVAKCVGEYLEFGCQRTRLAMRVDMFAAKSAVVLPQGFADIRYAHTPFRNGAYDQSVIDDFKEHFDEVDQLIEWIAACRFASNRKKTFLWLKASSDFGKGFFTTALKKLGLIVEMSTTEVEAIFEGRTSSRLPDDFLNAWILLVDEFKSTKSELKQLQQSMTLNPKYKMAVGVDLYAKIFLSAEGVDSLASDELGAESQFVNRFSFMEKDGNLSLRPKFLESSTIYMDSLVSYMGSKLNAHVAEYRAMGEIQAANEADIKVAKFHEKFSLAQEHGTIDIQMDDICMEFNTFVRKTMQSDIKGLTGDTRTIYESIIEKDGEVYVQRPVKTLAAFVEWRYPRATAGRLYPKLGQIIRKFYGKTRIVRIGSAIYKAIPID